MTYRCSRIGSREHHQDADACRGVEQGGARVALHAHRRASAGSAPSMIGVDHGAALCYHMTHGEPSSWYSKFARTLPRQKCQVRTRSACGGMVADRRAGTERASEVLHQRANASPVAPPRRACSSPVPPRALGDVAHDRLNSAVGRQARISTANPVLALADRLSATCRVRVRKHQRRWLLFASVASW